MSFQEGWSADAALEVDFFIVGFFTVADFLAGVAFLVAPDLATRDDLARAGDFFPMAASGAGEARGEGIGEDIAWVMLELVAWDDDSGGGESWKSVVRTQSRATLYPLTRRVASRVRSRRLLIAKPYLARTATGFLRPTKLACTVTLPPQGSGRNPGFINALYCTSFDLA